MDTTGVLRDIRVRLGDADGILDPTELDYSDALLLEYVASAIDELESFDVVSTDYTVSSGLISPDPSTIDGLLMSTWVVAQLLGTDVVERVRNGELGIRFKSGQDEISTIEAARQIKTASELAKQNYREVVGMKLGGSSNASERLQ